MLFLRVHWVWIKVIQCWSERKWLRVKSGSLEVFGPLGCINNVACTTFKPTDAQQPHS